MPSPSCPLPRLRRERGLYPFPAPLGRVPAPGCPLGRALGMRGVTPSPLSSCSLPRSFLAAARRALPRSSHPLPPIRPPRSSQRSRRRRNPLTTGRGAGRSRAGDGCAQCRDATGRGRHDNGGRRRGCRDARSRRARGALIVRDRGVHPGSPGRGGPSLGADTHRRGRGRGRAPPAANIGRPPPPPDPGTGLSTIVDRGTNGRLEVALTFDAGADTGYAAEILDLLRDEGIKASFGMTGVWAQANPELVQRMVAEGHQLINHTWDHASLTGANTQMPPQTPEQVAQQLADTEAVVRDLTDYEMRPYFRPPYGDYDAASLGYLYDNGYSGASGGPATPAAGPAGALNRSSTTARPTSPKTRSCSCMSALRPWETSSAAGSDPVLSG